jgi:hypothetical protein
MIPGNCSTLDVALINGMNDVVTIYPNPFGMSVTIAVNDISKMDNYQVRIYNVLGEEVMNASITNQTTTIATSKLPSGIYFYQIVSDDQLIQSGKLIAQH